MAEKLTELILGGIIAVLWWFFRDRIKQMDDQIKANAEKVEAIKTNYLDRFQDLRDLVMSGHDDIKDAISDLKQDLARNYMSKEDCEKLHTRR
jgi:gas vesicle protein